MAQPPPDAGLPPDSIMLQKFAGLRNTVSAERLTPEEFEIAQNIDLDDAGQVHRRRGYTRIATGNFHSLFQGSWYVYAVKDGNLGIVNADGSFRVLKTGIGPDKLAYVEVDRKVYFSSLSASGVINKDQTVSDWGAVDSQGYWYSPVVKPTATLNPISGTYLHAPPMANVLGYWNGRIYLANGKDLWATELYLYDSVDRTENYLQFEADITLIGTVTDGMYVGTTTDVWFLSGAFKEMRRIPVVRYGALYGSLVTIPAELVGGEQSSSKNAVLFMTESGLFAGMDGGMCYNLTQNRVLFPSATSAAALFRRQDGVNQYVGVLDSQGSPSSAARIGDYVDAEIRRFRGA